MSPGGCIPAGLGPGGGPGGIPAGGPRPGGKGCAPDEMTSVTPSDLAAIRSFSACRCTASSSFMYASTSLSADEAKIDSSPGGAEALHKYRLTIENLLFLV